MILVKHDIFLLKFSYCHNDSVKPPGLIQNSTFKGGLVQKSGKYAAKGSKNESVKESLS